MRDDDDRPRRPGRRVATGARWRCSSTATPTGSTPCVAGSSAIREDALDATQEAMIAIARGIDRFDGRAAFSTWCYRVATNAALDELRRQATAGPSPPIPTVTSRVDARPRASTTRGRARLDVDAALATRARGLPGRGRCCATCATSTTPRSPRCSTIPPGHGPVAHLPGARAPRGTTGPGGGRETSLGTASPPPNVRTTMADDDADDQRDERIADVARGRAARRAHPPAARSPARCRRRHGSAEHRPRSRRAVALDRGRGRVIVVVLVGALARRHRAERERVTTERRTASTRAGRDRIQQASPADRRPRRSPIAAR